mgnify:CR=1 FL=1
MLKSYTQKIVIVALGASMLTACETNTVSGRQQLVLVSESEAQQASAQAYTQTLSEAQSKGRLNTDAALNARVRRITDRLIVQAGNMYPESRSWQWSIAVIDEPKINAWAMPGGKMAIYTGIIQKLSLSDDEIAQIMGHEISHAILGHGRERMSRAMATQGGLQLGSVLVGRDLTGFESVATVALHVNSLIKRGHLRKRDRSARSLEVMTVTEAAPLKTNEVKPSEEKWLVEKIEYFFKNLESEGTLEPHKIDELYVLIGALRVLGLEGAAQSFIPRLTALKERVNPVQS